MTIFYYGPVLVILILNMIMFVATLRKIKGAQQHLAQMVDTRNAQRNIQNQKHK